MGKQRKTNINNKEIARYRRLQKSSRLNNSNSKEYTRVVFDSYIKSNEGKKLGEIFKVSFREQEISVLPYIVNGITYLHDSTTYETILKALGAVYTIYTYQMGRSIDEYADLMSEDDMYILKSLVPNISIYQSEYPDRIALVALLKDKQVFLRVVAREILNRVYKVWDILGDVVDFKDRVDNTLALSVLLSFKWLQSQKALCPVELKKIELDERIEKTIVADGLFDQYYKGKIGAEELYRERWENKYRSTGAVSAGEVKSDTQALNGDKIVGVEKYNNQEANREIEDLSPILIEVLGEAGYDIQHDNEGIIDDLKHKPLLYDLIDSIVAQMVGLEYDTMFIGEYLEVLANHGLEMVVPMYDKLTDKLNWVQGSLKEAESLSKKQKREIQRYRKDNQDKDKIINTLKDRLDTGDKEFKRSMEEEVSARDSKISSLLAENNRLKAELLELQNSKATIVKENSSLKKQVKKLKAVLNNTDNLEDSTSIDDENSLSADTSNMNGLLGEAVEYVKNKKWIIAGGDESVTRKLNELGIYGFTQINGNYNKSLVNQFEFAVIITYKIGHRISDPIKDLAKGMEKPVVHMNSSNINKMLVKIYKELELKGQCMQC